LALIYFQKLESVADNIFTIGCLLWVAALWLFALLSTIAA